MENHLTQIPITPNHQVLLEMKEEVLASAGAQDTSGNELSDFEDIEFFWENSQLELGAVFGPGINTLFSPTSFNDLAIGEGGSWENPIVFDKQEDKQTSPLTTLVSNCPAEAPRCLRTRPFGKRIEKVPDFVFTSLFE